jgi:hypothetical protein
MAGIKALRRLQIGLESTAGTAVAATAVWRGVGMGKDTLEVVHPEEDVGILGGLDRAYIPKVEAEITLDETPATFEQIGYILESGILKIAAPTADGAGSGKIYTYTWPTTAQNTPRTYTIEFGDDQQEEEAAYCHVAEFTLSGKAGEALNMTATLKGRQVAASTFTGSLSLPTVEEILFSKGKLYIDAVSTFPATTQKSNTFLEMELKVTTGFVPVYTGDGQLYFSFVKNVMPEIGLDITFEHDATAVAEKAAWRAGTARSLRILFEGATLSSAGTTYSKKTLAIDLVGKWETFDAIGDNDGNDIVKGTMKCRYNATAASAGRIIVVNELAALP